MSKRTINSINTNSCLGTWITSARLTRKRTPPVTPLSNLHHPTPTSTTFLHQQNWALLARIHSRYFRRPILTSSLVRWCQNNRKELSRHLLNLTVQSTVRWILSLIRAQTNLEGKFTLNEEWEEPIDPISHTLFSQNTTKTITCFYPLSNQTLITL